MYEHSHIQKRDSIHIEWIHYIWRMNVCDNDAIYSNWMGCECFNFCLLSFHFGSLKELTLNNPIFFHSTDFFFSFPRLSRINMTKSSMLSWQKLFLKATYKQQKQQRQWQQKKLSNIIFHLRFGTVHPRAHHWMCPTHESNHCVVNVCLPICVCFVVAVQFFPSFFWLLHSHTLWVQIDSMPNDFFVVVVIVARSMLSITTYYSSLYIVAAGHCFCTKHHDISGRYLCSDDFFPLSSSFLSYFFFN